MVARSTRTRVKICGLTREQDIVAAARAGADAVGLVFYAPSPRAVEVEQARALIDVMPAFVTSVGLFVDAAPDYVTEVMSRVPLDLLQFHGDEDPAYCDGFNRPWIKAVRMRAGVDVSALAKRYGAAANLLLDTYESGVAGGTGRSFNWDLIPSWMAPGVILAGGLTPDNVADAICAVRPYAVDVSGGVEAAKGLKDESKIVAFMNGVTDGDHSR